MEQKRGIIELSDQRTFVYANAKYLLSAGTVDQFPTISGKEFCILGRSNVGKSSFLNHVLENNNLAKVSKKPGKTDCANFYSVGEDIYWVDMPGYGYAKKSHSHKDRWNSLIENYCEKRTNLEGFIWLVDSRHTDLDNDQEAYQWLLGLQKPIFLLLTKIDKLSQSESAKLLRAATSTYPAITQIVSYTIEKNVSRDRFWRTFLEWIHW